MDKMWYYAKPGSTDRHGPIASAEMKALVAKGTVIDTDLVWSEGMSNWITVEACIELKEDVAGVNPILASAMGSSMQPESAVINPAVIPAHPMVNELPEGLLGWMKFVGVMTIISGILNCLTCIGIVMGIPMILGGNALLRSRDILSALAKYPAELLPFFEKLKSYSKNMGVLYIITIIFVIISLVIQFAFLGTMMSQMQGMGFNPP